MKTPAANSRTDFLIGFFGFFGFNLALGLLLWRIGSGMNLLPQSVSASAAANRVGIFLFCCFPGLANIGAEIYFFAKRRWVAFGGLIALGASIVLASLAVAALIVSGFTLV